GGRQAQEPAVETLPPVTGRLRYSISADQTLRGTPIREGELWYLSAEERVEQVTFSLHVNGFAFVHGSHETHVSLSPFCLVRNCKFQSNYSNSNLMDMKIFKVSLFAQGVCHYLGVRAEAESEAEEERSQWVLDISRVMRLVTQSVFPPFRISCEPLSAVVSTKRRLMAGYLIHRDDERVASVLYVELHPQDEDQAKLVLYENELCQVPVTDIYLTEQSLCCEKVGINCSCFCVEDDHQFSTRTLAERKLWLRAISNVKVKLQNKAPSPNEEERQHYREAIKDPSTSRSSGPRWTCRRPWIRCCSPCPRGPALRPPRRAHPRRLRAGRRPHRARREGRRGPRGRRRRRGRGLGRRPRRGQGAG
ncbi:unnamed protein product, partial [Prorocentrum cordatum]